MKETRRGNKLKRMEGNVRKGTRKGEKLGREERRGRKQRRRREEEMRREGGKERGREKRRGNKLNYSFLSCFFGTRRAHRWLIGCSWEGDTHFYT